MNLNEVTIEDCLDMFNVLGKAVVINDGKILGFQKEECPTADQSK